MPLPLLHIPIRFEYLQEKSWRILASPTPIPRTNPWIQIQNIITILDYAYSKLDRVEEMAQKN